MGFKILAEDGSIFDNVEEYEKSEAWRRKRSERLALDHFKCQWCRSEMNLQVHHLTYDRAGKEDVYRDLVTLCKFCHYKVHTKEVSLLEQYTPNHWQYYNIDATVKFLKEYMKTDTHYPDGSGENNLCSTPVIRALADKFAQENYGIDMAEKGLISTNDVQAFTSNVRLCLAYRKLHMDRMTLDEFMKECFPAASGEKRSQIRAYYKKFSVNDKKVECLIKEHFAWMQDLCDAMGLVNPFEKYYGGKK